MNTHITPNEVTKVYGVGIRWTDREGITHAVEGSETLDEGRLLWPRCGDGEVPTGEASFGNAGVTCPRCVAIMAGEAKRSVGASATVRFATATPWSPWRTAK
ncbi:hypothetical protein [Mesorhizobium sp. CN2-181]|uniref:hypothetical protein n=1 Tax=Mesorhizobium yinganensis TaxID=3157707 RepID=UPI0032B87E5E